MDAQTDGNSETPTSAVPPRLHADGLRSGVTALILTAALQVVSGRADAHEASAGVHGATRTGLI